MLLLLLLLSLGLIHLDLPNFYTISQNFASRTSMFQNHILTRHLTRPTCFISLGGSVAHSEMASQFFFQFWTLRICGFHICVDDGHICPHILEDQWSTQGVPGPQSSTSKISFYNRMPGRTSFPSTSGVQSLDGCV